MSDPVAELSGELERVSSDEAAAPDTPPRSLDAEEVPHDAGIPEQLAKKQGPWPSSNRTQVERDAQYTAATGAIDVNNEIEDVSPVVTPDDMEPAIPEGSTIADVTEHCDRLADELEEVADLKRSLDRITSAAKKVSEPETIDHSTALKKTAMNRVARILVKSGMDVGIGLPSEVRPVNQKFINDLNDEARPSDSWDDMGWWYEKNFKVASDQREAFKTALFMEMAGNGERDHQFVAKDVPEGVKISVDRTPSGLNPQFTKDVDRIYEGQFLAGHKKAAGEIKMLIVRKTMIPQEDHVCPHCEQVIGEKESYWPEEYRDHPDLMISQHRPCGGLYSQEHKPIPDPIKALMESLNGDRFGNPLDLNGDPMKPHTHDREELCPGCEKPQGECICGSAKMAADLPYRRRVEVIITDGLNVWGEKKKPEKGGVWFPGGGVDSRNEKFADAAAREVIEESGFKIKEIYRLANVPPCTCDWDQSIIDESEKWAEKGKKWRGDRTHMYVATIEGQREPTSTEGDVMPGEWMTFSSAIRKLRNAIPHDNQGWKPLTRARLRSLMQLAPAGLRVPAKGEVEDIIEDVTDEVA